GAQAMSPSLLVKPALPAAGGQVHRITPESAGWRYVGFEVFDLLAGQGLVRESSDREQCLVLLSGRASVSVDGRDFGAIGGRRSPFDGKPFAVYAPPRSRLTVAAEANCELAVGSAPAEGRAPLSSASTRTIGRWTRPSASRIATSFWCHAATTRSVLRTASSSIT